MSYADFMRAKHGPKAAPAVSAPTTPTVAPLPDMSKINSSFLGGPVPTVAPATSTVMAPPTVMAPANPLAGLTPEQMMQGVAEGTSNYDLIAVSDELSRRRDQTETPNQPVAQPAMVANQMPPPDPIGGTPQPIASPNQVFDFLSANAPPTDPARPVGLSTSDMRPQYDAEGNLTGYGPSSGVGSSGTEGASNYGLVPDPTVASTPTNFMVRPGLELGRPELLELELGMTGATVPPLRGIGGSDLSVALPPATPSTMVNVGSNMTAGQNLTVDPNTRYQPTTTMTASGATPYQEYGLTEAQRLYEQGAPEYYQGQTFTDFAPQTEQALRAQEERALAGSPVMQAAQDLTQKTLSGGFLGSNPYLEGAIQRALDPVQSRINSQLAQRGRAGSGLAAAEMSRALGGVAGDISYRDYSTERGRQQDALRYAPAMAEADYADIAQLGSVGVARQEQAQKSIDDAMARYEYAQEAPFTALGQYSDFLGSFPAGTTSQVYNPYNPPTESQQQMQSAAAVAGMLPSNASTTDKLIAALLGGLL